TDYGMTWELLDARQPLTFFCDPAVLVGPVVRPLAYSVGRRGTGYPTWLRSLDGGATWMKVDPPVSASTADAPSAFAPDGTLLLSRGNGIWSLAPPANSGE